MFSIFFLCRRASHTILLPLVRLPQQLYKNITKISLFFFLLLSSCLRFCCKFRCKFHVIAKIKFGGNFKSKQVKTASAVWWVHSPLTSMWLPSVHSRLIQQSKDVGNWILNCWGGLCVSPWIGHGDELLIRLSRCPPSPQRSAGTDSSTLCVHDKRWQKTACLLNRRAVYAASLHSHTEF